MPAEEQTETETNTEESQNTNQTELSANELPVIEKEESSREGQFSQIEITEVENNDIAKCNENQKQNSTEEPEIIDNATRQA